MIQAHKIMLMIGWRTNKQSGLLSEKHNLIQNTLPYGLVLYTDKENKCEYFGIRLMEINEFDISGANSINYLDVSEKYGILFDLLAKNGTHIDYKIGRPRIWCIPVI